MSQSTVSRAISGITQILKKVLAGYVPTADELDENTQYIIDGTMLPSWARALAGQPPEPGDLPAPAPEFLKHVAAMTSSPPTTPQQRIAENVETWRILNGTALPFDADAARRHVEASMARARDFQAATHHDPAGRQMTPERQAPLSRITAPPARMVTMPRE